MDIAEIATKGYVEEKESRLKIYLIKEFEALKKQIEEQGKPYIWWGENLSLKQAKEYTGRSKSAILKWVEDGLLTSYPLGSSTSVYYSKNEIDSIKSRWEYKKRNKELKKAV